jgi:signal transduction histidine kinase/ActR/RegA family two-component response regulator
MVLRSAGQSMPDRSIASQSIAGQSMSRQSMFWRLMPTVAVITALALLAGAVAVAWYLDRTYRAEKTAEVSVQAEILASTVTAALAFSDQQAGQEYVKALAINPEVVAAAVYDASGKVFVSFNRRRTDAVPDRAPVNPPRFEGNEVVVVAPVVQAGTTLGTVYLRTVMEPLARRVERYAVMGSLVIMGALLLAALGVAQRALTRANAELAGQGQQLATANASLIEQIEQREKAEEALRQAQKMEAIGQLTGGIAHDFNNLLQVILGSLERLDRRMTDPTHAADATDRRLIDAATRGADRAAVLTKRLLAFSRRQTLEPTTIDVNKLVNGMTDMLTRTLGPAVRISAVLEGGVWQVFADENQLENALLNLAVNARDAMPEGGRLTIATSNAVLPDSEAPMPQEIVPGDYTMITITDTGSGMGKDVVAKAFDPFFTTKDIGHGTGLGLSQVYGFVKQSGGHVWIISEPGKGTSVRLYLRRHTALAHVAGEAGDDAVPDPVPRADGSEMILVVDDEDDVRVATVEILRDLGYDVIEAPDGQVALRRLVQVPGIRLLLTDVGLPGGMDGVRLAETARHRHPDLPVIFTTGYAREAFAANRPLTAGAEILRKPFTGADLARKLREVLDGTRAGLP